MTTVRADYIARLIAADPVTEMAIYLAVDSNGNRGVVSPTAWMHDSLPVVLFMCEGSGAYLAAVEPDGAFGTDDAPSSYGVPCLGWLRDGESVADAAQRMSLRRRGEAPPVLGAARGKTV